MLCCRLCSTRYTAVRIENRSKSTSAIKTATMKNTDNFRYERNLLRAIAKLTLFTVSKDEWDTKEDTGKSIKNALHVLRYTKKHLSVIKLCLSEGISQSGSQSVENSIKQIINF